MSNRGNRMPSSRVFLGQKQEENEEEEEEEEGWKEWLYIINVLYNDI